MNSPPPFEGAPSGDDEDRPYEWLDEWLCEYVDGTMDPSLEAVFEQYVEANPELKAHVERLQETRDLLCECGLPKEAPPELESEICTEVECDMLQSETPVSDAIWDRPLAAFGVASSIAAALVIGFLAGATLVGPSPSAVAPSPSADAPSVDRVAADAPAPSPPSARSPTSSVEVRPLPLADSTQQLSTLTTLSLP